MLERIRCTIIVPVHNERKNIVRNLRSLTDAVRAQLGGAAFELLLIDNGSTDGTETLAAQVAEETGARLLCVATKGRGVALRHGFSEAKGECVGVLSIDRAWSEEFLGEALALLDAGADVVYGPKSHPGSRVNRPRVRGMASIVTRWVLFLFFGLRPQDTQCIKCFRIAKIPFLAELHNYNYFAETEFFLRASRCDLTTRSIPVAVKDPGLGSKVRIGSFFEFLKEAWHFKKTVWEPQKAAAGRRAA